MKISDLFPAANQLNLIQGIEANLRRKKRLGDLGGISMMILGALYQILNESFDLTHLKEAALYIYDLAFFLGSKIFWYDATFDNELTPELLGFFLILFGIGFILASRHTKFLIKESEEPFRYTFWIDEFNCVGADEAEQDKEIKDRLLLLHHDLMERLNQRIQRFTLLDLKNSDQDNLDSQLSSHINIDGNYAVREKNDDERVIHVMPRVRIGPAGRSSTLANPVKFSLKNIEDEGSEKEYKLDAQRYNQLVERVYSSVATEVYMQVESDVKQKMKLFPTKYLRAVAYFNEAEDYVKSNTVDAYDRAIELYQQARKYFQVSNSSWKTKLLVPVLWRFSVKFLQMQAKVEIGYAKCLIYRRQISALSGRHRNPLFEIPKNLDRVTRTLEKLHNLIIPRSLPKLIARKKRLSREERIENRSNSLKAYFGFSDDSGFRSQKLFLKHTRLRFEAYVVNALTHYYLGAIKTANEYLEDAKSVDPKLSETDTLYLLTMALIERDLDEEVILFRKATEMAPNFEIAQFLLAQNAEMRFHRQDEIAPGRDEGVIKKYEEVLKINPGNIAALVRIGYIYWLVENMDSAKKRLEEGRETKARVRQTFTGNLNYGLARIAAEKGNFEECYDQYAEAILSDPGLGAYSMEIIGAYSTATAGASLELSTETNPVEASRAVATPYFEYIGPGMLKRFKKFKDNVEKEISKRTSGKTKNGQQKETLTRTVNVVHSFVLNDYGNACLNYYLRHGDRAKDELENAISAYQQAIQRDDQNQTAYFNLQHAYRYRDKQGDAEKASKCLKKAGRLSPTWSELLIDSIKSEFRKIQDLINEKSELLEDANRRRKSELEKVITKKRELLEDANRRKSEKVNAKREQSYPARSESIPKKSVESWDDLLSNGSKNDNSELQKLWSKIDKIESEINRLKERVKDVFKDFDKITSHTKLSSLDFDYEGQSVAELPDGDDLESKLDEKDLYVLSVWAEFLLHNDYSDVDKEESSDPQAFAEKLCQFLQNFYPEHFDYHYLKGNIYYEKRDYEDAIAAYKRAVKSKNSNDIYHNRLGHAYFNSTAGDITKNYEEAVKNFRKATELNRQNPIYHCNLGRATGRLENWEKMIKHCQEAISLRKERPEDNYSLVYYYEYLAKAYFNADQLKEFEKEVEDDEDLTNPNCARLHNYVGNLYYDQKAYQDAVSYYLKAEQFDPENPRFPANAGVTCGNMGDGQGMIRHCRKAVELRRNRPKDDKGMDHYYGFLAEAYVKYDQKKLDKFEKEFDADNDITDTERASVYNRMGNLFYDRAQYQSAISYYEKATQLDNEIPIYQTNIGVSYRELQGWEQMIEHCQKAVLLRKNRPEDEFGLDYYYEFLAEAHFNEKRLSEFEIGFEADDDLEDVERARVYNRIGNLFYGREEYESAISYYEKAIRFDSKTPIYQTNIGVSYKELEKWDQMIDHCQKAVLLRKDRPDEFGLGYYYEFLAEAHVKANRLREFKIEFDTDDALKDMERARVYNHIGNLFNEREEYESAISYYEKACELDAGRPVYHSNLGLAFMNLQDWNKAEAEVLNAIKLDTENAVYENDLGNIYYRSNDFEGAEIRYRRAVEKDPKNAVFYSNLSLALTKLYKWNEAEEAALKAIELDPLSARNENELGNIYYRWDYYEKATTRYERAIEKDPENPVFYSNLGLAFMKLQQWNEAEKAALNAMRLDPRNPIYQNDLGNIYYRIQKYEKAASQYKSAVKLDPEKPIFYSNLMLALELSGNSEEVERTYEKVKNIKPNDASFQNDLGNAFLQNGDYNRAQECFRRATELDPESTQYQKNLDLVTGKSI